MKRILLMAAGGLVTLFGLLFLLQGSGLVKGSPMTDNHFWIYAGALIALVGAAILTFGLRSSRTRIR